MSIAGHDSSADFGLEPYVINEGVPAAGDDQAVVWLDGDVLACACPDCNAPMSIRLWLMLADCFRCGATIELTEEQEREALRLLRERETQRRAESAAAAAAIQPRITRRPKRADAELRKPEPRIHRPAPPVPSRAASPAAPTETGPPRQPAQARDSGAWSDPSPAAAPKPPGSPETMPVRRRVAASQAHRGVRARVRQLYKRGGLAVWLSEFLRDLPAWLVSFVFHLVLLLLLSLWMVEPLQEQITLTLSTSISEHDLEGQIGELNPKVEPLDFEDPGAIEVLHAIDDPGAGRQVKPELDPADLPMDLHAAVSYIPSAVVREVDPMPPVRAGSMLSGRDPKARAHLVQATGGTSQTEAAVARGLEWIARRQNSDGSWSLHDFHKSPGADGKGEGMGSERSHMAGTALALLPFLGAGQTHLSGKYTENVFNGLKWLLENQHSDGDLRGAGSGRMYAHGLAAIVLAEAYTLTGDDQLREPAQLALNYIIRAQHPAGGWRYEPRQPGDTSVVGWQLMALQSGRMGQLRVPRKTFDLASDFLDSVQRDSIGGRYAYMPGRQPTNVMTAQALLSRQYLGWPKDHPGLRDGARFLLENHPPSKEAPDVYYWYYATQVMHHLGGDLWRRWNAQMRRVLCDTQESTGHEAGSWAPRGPFADRGGRLFMTSLAVCTLEVYYRHLPLYADDLIEQTERLLQEEEDTDAELLEETR
ncbi:MAG: terpene cyclase/mutase family protein [Thermoguttaceae bacterium]|jgi:hypothetical protein|nr:terpene cyclase/mutase family protein [Thermoguttaceae bacterium]